MKNAWTVCSLFSCLCSFTAAVNVDAPHALIKSDEGSIAALNMDYETILFQHGLNATLIAANVDAIAKEDHSEVPIGMVLSVTAEKLFDFYLAELDFFKTRNYFGYTSRMKDICTAVLHTMWHNVGAKGVCGRRGKVFQCMGEMEYVSETYHDAWFMYRNSTESAAIKMVTNNNTNARCAGFGNHVYDASNGQIYRCFLTGMNDTRVCYGC